MADAMRTEPVLVNQLVRIAIVRLACGTMRDISEVKLPDAQQSVSMEEAFKSFEDIRPLVLAATSHADRQSSEVVFGAGFRAC